MSSSKKRIGNQQQEKSEGVWWRPQTWWTPIIVAIIGLAGTLFLFVNNNLSRSSNFEYIIRIQAKNTGNDITNAKVTIDLPGKVPQESLTDSNGVARIFISSDLAGLAGRLTVQAPGYKRYIQNIELIKGKLPDIIQIELAP